jgi:mevalonate kinase
MVPRGVTATAPGKCILFGEHAVVYGAPAVAVAIEQRMTVTLTPSTKWTVNGTPLHASKHPHIVSLMGHWGGATAMEPMDIAVSGDLPPASGLGSSAALSAAFLRSLERLTDRPMTEDEAGRYAHFAEADAQQGRASPMDTSTSLLGGLVVLSDRKEEELIHRYNRSLDTSEGAVTWSIHSLSTELEGVHLVIGNTGVHAPTAKQVQRVAERLTKHPEQRQAIDAIEAITRRGLAALKSGDAEAVGHAMSENHIVLRSLGVSSEALERLIEAASPTSLGVKLTGAGGGGCMVALTRDPEATARAVESVGGTAMITALSNPGAEASWTDA